jgi:hypothetical protein
MGESDELGQVNGSGNEQTTPAYVRDLGERARWVLLRLMIN